MSSKRIPIARGGEPSIPVEVGATVGATVGVNLRWEDGTLVTREELAPAPPAEGLEVTYWRMIREIPANVVALAGTTTTGLYVITGDGSSATRAIEPAAGETTVSNGDGVAGNPVVGLADVADSGSGALLAITRDAKGRVSGTKSATITGTAGQIEVADGDAIAGPPTISLADVTLAPGGTLQRYGFDAKGRRIEEEAADTDDLAEGASNLYFTDERAQDAVGAVADDSGDVELHYEASPARRLWAVLSSAVQSALSAAVSALQPGDDVSQLTNDAGYLTDAPSDGDIYGRKDGAWEQITTSGGGTVTSVGLSVPTGFQVSGSPVTTSGTLTVTYDTGYQGYTSAEASKLSGIEVGATVGADWSVNLSNIPANIASWAGIAPSDKVNTAGDTMTGNLVITNGGDLRLDNSAGNVRVIRWLTDGLNRWTLYANSSAESGGNAGSNLTIRRYADDGSTISPDPLNINRETGVVSLGFRPTFAGAVPWDSANFDLDSTGLNGGTPPTITNLDTVLGTNTRFFRWTSSGSTGAPASAGPALYLPYSGSAGAMVAFQPTSQAFYYRTQPVSGGWNPWHQVWTTNNLADSGWQALTYSNSWSAYTAGSRPTPGVRKFGSFCQLRGHIAPGTTTDGTLVATLPAGYRPTGTLDFLVGATNIDSVCRVRITSSGNITVYDVSGVVDAIALNSISFYVD